jgi:AraC-like DNA-binding protein
VSSRSSSVGGETGARRRAHRPAAPTHPYVSRASATGTESDPGSRDTGLLNLVPPARHLTRAKDLADARYFERLTVSDLARAASLSRAHFSREFRRAFGEPPHTYLLTRRLERAAVLLRTTDHSVADICLEVGLRSVGSFTTSFTRSFGMSPTAYRATYPPASQEARVPACVIRAYARSTHSTFREDRGAPQA